MLFLFTFQKSASNHHFIHPHFHCTKISKPEKHNYFFPHSNYITQLINLFYALYINFYAKNQESTFCLLSLADKMCPLFACFSTLCFLISKVYQANNPEDIYESKNGLTWRKEYIINRHGNNQGQIVITLKNIGEGIALSPFYEINLTQKTNEEEFPTFVNKCFHLKKINYALAKNL